jgi:alpha-glucuronidase
MHLRNAVSLVAVTLLAITPFAHSETGAEGWLRYAPLSAQAAQQYRKIPHRIVEATDSTIAHNAATELIRGLHSMLGQDFQLASTLPTEDAFLIGTPAEIHRLLPAWKAPAAVSAEGFSTSQFTTGRHTYWIIAGGTDRGELYGVFHILEQVAQQKPVAPDSESPSSPIRWVNQWDNLNGTIERGYAGRSIFFDDGHVRPDLTRVADYGRLLSSVGLNGATVNNVNSDLRTLQPDMIREFRPALDIRSS